MTDPRIVVVNSITQQTAAEPADYKTQMIIDCNHLSFDRVKTYAVGGYDDLLDGSDLKRALDSAFSSEIKPAVVKVGRAKGKTIYTPSTLVDGSSVGFSVEVLDGASATVNQVVVASNTVEEVLIIIKDTFDGITDISAHLTFTIVGSDDDAVLEITPIDSDDDYVISSFVGDYTLEFVATETASDTLDAVLDTGTGFSFVTSTSHVPAYQLALAAKVQTLQYIKYFGSTQLSAAYSDWDEVSVPSSDDIGGLLEFNGYNLSHTFYHNEADTKYPEMQRVSRLTQFEPGRSNAQFKALNGVGLAQIADGSRPLNTAELINLQKRNVSTIVRFGGQSVIGGYEGQGNRMHGGVRIETVFWQHFASNRIKELTETLFLKREKVGMNEADLNTIRGIWSSFLDTQVSTIGSTYALDPINPFTIFLPKAKDISFANKVSGLLDKAVITANMDASIDSLEATLVVTFNSSEGI